MNENFGTCPLCGGDKELGTTTFALDLNSGVVVVRDVPAFVRTNCREAWIDDPVAAMLEGVVDDSRRKKAFVEVTQWERAAG